MSRSGKCVSVHLVKNQALVADRCLVAESFFQRLRGLIGRAVLVNGEGMLFPRCNDIHMWFMRIPIDVVFLTKEESKIREQVPGGPGGPSIFKVASIRSRLRPWRPLPVRDGRASETLELPAGTVERCAIQVGDQLCIS